MVRTHAPFRLLCQEKIGAGCGYRTVARTLLSAPPQKMYQELQTLPQPSPQSGEGGRREIFSLPCLRGGLGGVCVSPIENVVSRLGFDRRVEAARQIFQGLNLLNGVTLFHVEKNRVVVQERIVVAADAALAF